MLLKIIIVTVCAVCSYLVGAFNPAIVLSRRLYGKDIRECGSGNAGFTNFKRTFGSKHAWWVFAIDLLKGAAVGALSGLCFLAVDLGWYGGVWVSGVCCLIGHAFPAWYGFKGGKGFLCTLSMAFLLDWRAGLLAFGVMAVLLLTVKIMSLSTLLGLAAGAVLLWFLCPSYAACAAYTVCVLFVWVRHRENLVRLFHGQERRFELFGNKQREQQEPPEPQGSQDQPESPEQREQQEQRK